MENAIHELEDQGVQSYILDLRNNPVMFFDNPFVFIEGNIHTYVYVCISIFSFELQLLFTHSAYDLLIIYDSGRAGKGRT